MAQFLCGTTCVAIKSTTCISQSFFRRIDFFLQVRAYLELLRSWETKCRPVTLSCTILLSTQSKLEEKERQRNLSSPTACERLSERSLSLGARGGKKVLSSFRRPGGERQTRALFPFYKCRQKEKSRTAHRDLAIFSLLKNDMEKIVTTCGVFPPFLSPRLTSNRITVK